VKISVCIPQYNRIAYLLKSLEIIARQTHADVEICVVDDASTDDTDAQLTRLLPTYRFPVRYVRHAVNEGYDRTLRHALRLATGDYCFTLGNDDTLADPGCLARLADFLEKTDRPDVGFTNYALDGAPHRPYRRARRTAVLGSGPDVAARHYASLAFVGGLVFRRDAFGRADTDVFDGSVFAQMGLGLRMMLAGGRLVTVDETMVTKDLRLSDGPAQSWREEVRRGDRCFRKRDGGLPRVVGVVQRAFAEAGYDDPRRTYRLLRKHYRQTYPHWLLEYRSHGGLMSALGLVAGLFPSGWHRRYRLGLGQAAGLFGWYGAATAVGLLTPTSLFQRVKLPLYNWLKSRLTALPG
jgi:glycosyltransferase involved in cell wall biosynthesis